MRVESAQAAIVVVGIADCRIARAPAAALATYALGSCIALVAWDWKLKLGGLLHIMLPDSAIDTAKATANPHLYVDTGVPALFRQLTDNGSSRKQLRWCLAGGACMMADSSHFEIGKRNQLAMKKVLWRLGVFIDREDLGGTESRSVRLDLETGQVDLRKGVAKEQILMQAAINLTNKEIR
jgi:chemotaxis protein CheD